MEPGAEPEPLDLQAFVVRLVDSDGKPMAGADAGLSAATLRHDPSDPPRWEFRHHAVSASDGTVQLEEGRSELDYIAFVAWHMGRRLVAIEPIGPEAALKPITVKMLPACRVSGRLTCSRPDGEPFPLRFPVVTLWRDEKLAMEFQPKGSAFWFELPSGEYRIEARADGTYFETQTFTAAPQEREVDLATTNLRPTRLSLSEGKSAPELDNALAWKNSGPLTMRDLRGKVVLLNFWGYWCGACIERMPKLFELHDEYADDGLAIIGIHIDADQRIDSAEKLDQKLEETRRTLWNGRDIPYPVMMVSGEDVPPHGGTASDNAPCQLAADYGVLSYPTYVLIDREGRVVGKFVPSKPEHMALLKKLLAARQ